MRLACLVFGLMFVVGVRAADIYTLIGGGPVLHNSQGQIELNVKWVQQVIANKVPGAEITTFYTDGADPLPDVVAYDPSLLAKSHLTPLALVFDNYVNNMETYYNHSVANVQGTTRKELLSAELAERFKQLRSGERVTLVYNGHGAYDDDDFNRNSLKLWGRSYLNVYEFERLLASIDPDASVRYVMTQCYSGAFTRAVFKGADQGEAVLGGKRCGFTAESATRKAEGCSASLLVNDYRDYTTYFFAALDGKDRLGAKLTVSADRNGDGSVSLYEAHYYAIEQGVSTDLSRSTSEAYLEDWLPWSVRWQALPPADNIYGEVAERVARNNGMADYADSVSKLQQLRAEEDSVLSEMLGKYSDIDNQMKDLRDEVREGLVQRWPQLRYPYTDNFMALISNAKSLQQITGYLQGEERFIRLRGMQEQLDQLQAASLQQERRLTQVDKVIRYKRLSGLLVYFERQADEKARADFQTIVSCEQGGL